MKNYSVSCRQGGFTLVEIAIVLMIVGLLIGGILRGQELIQSARVRNIIDQKSAVQAAYIGFMDRYRMLPGDLTATQIAIVGPGVRASAGLGGIGGPADGNITWANESVLFFQNLTASGFLACGACMTAGGNALPTTNNSPINVYGEFLIAGNQTSSNNGANWFDTVAGINRLILYTGAGIPSQVLAEVDRKADDGLPGSGALRFNPGNDPGEASLATCATGLAAATPAVPWAIPNQANCAAAWLF